MKLSNAARDYINTYNRILDKMIQRMTNTELTDSISYNFIAQMIPHHKAAIEMSANILKYTTNATLQNIAAQIIKEQTKSIGNMNRIKHCCSEAVNTKQDLYLYQKRMEQIMENMFLKMKNSHTTNQINCDFMWEMIPHHLGAIKMSENTLQYKICDELNPILQSIITSQKRGVLQMRDLSRSLSC